jgi:hypothetical protein
MHRQRRGVLWRFGASLHRLLPIIELNKELRTSSITRRRPGEPCKLYRWQLVFFSAVALAGWVILLLATMGGLTPK